MVSPEDFGLTPRQAAAVRAGKAMEWGMDTDKPNYSNRRSSLQLSTLVKVIAQNPPTTPEEANTMLKLLEGALGKTANEYLAEVDEVRAKTQEARSDGADASVLEALDIVAQDAKYQEFTDNVNRLKDLADNEGVAS
jgi:hypothetical protein